MSFQMYSREQPRFLHRIKNLPSIEIIKQLNMLCEGSENTYDARNHVLTINSLDQFERLLKERCQRSLGSYDKQLKMVGFKRRRKIEEIEDRGDSQHEGSAIGDECNQRILIKYIWRGKNAVLINSELESAEARLTQNLNEGLRFKEELSAKRKKLDGLIESIIFSTMVDSAPPDIIAERIREATQLSRSVINNAHRRSKLVLQNVSATLSNELFLYRLMIYKDRGDES